MMTATQFRPILPAPTDAPKRWLGFLKQINYGWLFKRLPMLALALLSSWGVGGFISQSGEAPLFVSIIGSGAFDLVFLGVIALADQQLTSRRSTSILYWVLNVGAAALAALLNTLYYSGGTYGGITAESITHGAPFAIFGLLYSLYYHSVMSVAIEHDEAENDRLAQIVPCRYCQMECRNLQAMYSHFRTCPEHPKNKR
jgi:hypothetical protein